jgi:hypothetical protein
MLNFIVSTLAFFIAAWYINRYLDEQDIAQGMTRRILVLVLASVVSAGAGSVVAWFGAPEPAPKSLSLPVIPQPQ